MFTGIIEELGSVQSIFSGSVSGEISIQAKTVMEGTKLGDSIAVNGICLTVIHIGKDGFVANVMPETLQRTNLGNLRKGDLVNLERALAANGRLGGHIVSGHIDGTGVIISLRRDGNAFLVGIKTSAEILSMVVEKGSIAIDGISLTVVSVSDTDFLVSVIPHTGKETTLLNNETGATVNLETDIIGKYIKKLLMPMEISSKKNNLTLEFLAEHGF